MDVSYGNKVQIWHPLPLPQSFFTQSDVLYATDWLTNQVPCRPRKRTAVVDAKLKLAQTLQRTTKIRFLERDLNSHDRIIGL